MFLVPFNCNFTSLFYWLLHKSLYDRGKKGQKAAVAVANKILNIGYALCKSRSTYSYEGCETELRRKLKSYGLEAIAGTNTNSAAEVTRPTN